MHRRLAARVPFRVTPPCGTTTDVAVGAATPPEYVHSPNASASAAALPNAAAPAISARAVPAAHVAAVPAVLAAAVLAVPAAAVPAAEPAVATASREQERESAMVEAPPVDVAKR